MNNILIWSIRIKKEGIFSPIDHIFNSIVILLNTLAVKILVLIINAREIINTKRVIKNIWVKINYLIIIMFKFKSYKSEYLGR